jgi:hypothetical protein
MDKTPSYYRARLGAFQQIIQEEAGGARDEKNNHSVILRNGVVPGGFEKRMSSLIKEKQKDFSNAALSFEEITRFNTWFEMHPEKVAGTEVVTTSREFPIMIKGTEEDLIQTVTPSKTPDKKDKRIRMARAKAIARKRSLELMNI